MPANNYFKVDNEFFVFDKYSDSSTRKAYALAKSFSDSRHNPRTNRTPRILVWEPTELFYGLLRVGESPEPELVAQPTN